MTNLKNKHPYIGDQASMTEVNPYKALTSYQEKDRDVFFGREKEVEDLFKMVKNNSLTVVYGKSGIGKTSLLNAGLFPRLRDEGFRPIRIRLNFSENACLLKEQICNAVAAGLAPTDAAESKVEMESQIEGIPPGPFSADETLWEYFRRVNHFITNEKGEKKVTTPVLVFDQFEEIFTLGKFHEERDQIIDELYWLLEDQIPPEIDKKVKEGKTVAKRVLFAQVKSKFKVILSLREDYLPHLSGLKTKIPFIGKASFWINHLNGNQAREIISKPKNGFKDENTIKSILFLFYPKEATERGNIPEEKLEIEPAFLSLLCHQMYVRNIFKAMSSLEVRRLLEAYYKSTMQAYPGEVHKFIESYLLTDAGFRTPRYLEEAHPLKREIDKLIEQRILRRFHDGYNEYIELVHDFLSPIILERRSRREQKRRSKLISLLAIVSIMFMFLALFALFQLDRAEKQYNIAQVNRLTAEALLEFPRDNTKALRIAESAIKKARQSSEIPPFNVLSDIAYSSVQKPFYNNITSLKSNDVIRDVSFSADGQKIITGHEDGSIHIRDLDGTTLMLLKGHNGRVSSVLFSPDQKFILSGSWDRTVRLWTQAGDLILKREHDGPVTSVTFAPDGKRFLSTSLDKTARLWNLDGNLIHIFKHDGKVLSAVFAPDGKFITVSWDNTIRTWNEKGEQVDKFIHENTLLSSVIAPNCESILIAKSNNTIQLWNIKNKKFEIAIPYEGRLSMMKFSLESDYILTGNEEGKLKLFDLKGNQVAQFDKHGRRITAAAFSPGDQLIFSSSESEASILWGLQNNLVVALEKKEEISSVEFSSDKQFIVTVTRDGDARLYNNEGKLLTTFKHEGAKIIKILFSPKMDFILTGSNNGLIKRWSIEGKFIEDLDGFGNRLTNLLINEDGSKIGILSGSKIATIGTPEGKIVEKVEQDENICNAEFSPTDKDRLLTVSCSDGKIYLWNFNGIPPVLLEQTNIASISFSPDGSRLIVSSKTGKIIIYDLFGNLLHIFNIPLDNNQEIVSATLSPNNEGILVLPNEGPVSLWGLDGVRLAEFSHEQRIFTAIFSHSGENILTASLDKRVNLWDTAGNVLATLNHDSAVFFAGFSTNDERIVTICRDKVAIMWLTPSAIFQWLKKSRIPKLTDKDRKELGLATSK